MTDPFILFTFMLSVAARSVLTVMTLPLLILFGEHFKPSQRIGLALAASGSMMMVPIYFMGANRTPFDGWASLMETIGVIMFLWSTTLRHFRHHWQNVQQARYYDRVLRKRDDLI